MKKNFILFIFYFILIYYKINAIILKILRKILSFRGKKKLIKYYITCKKKKKRIVRTFLWNIIYFFAYVLKYFYKIISCYKIVNIISYSINKHDIIQRYSLKWQFYELCENLTFLIDYIGSLTISVYYCNINSFILQFFYHYSHSFITII